LKNIKLPFVIFLLLLFLLPDSFAQIKTKGELMKKENNTKCVGGLIKLKPEFEERYIILHRHTFPGVLERIKKSNIRNYTIFLLNGILFSHYEYVGNNFKADMDAIADPVTRDWWKLTDPMQEPIDPRNKGEWWASVEMWLRVDKAIKSSAKAKRIGLTAQIAQGNEEAVKKILSNYPEKVKQATYKENFQKHTVYYRDGKLYLYYEYLGDDLNKSLAALRKNEAFSNFQNELNMHLVTIGNDPWVEMKEVFHTN